MFYDNFINLCVERNVNKATVGRAIGISSAAISKWKDGGMPTDVTLAKLADYFKVPAEQLLKDINTKESSQPQAGSDLEPLSKEEREVLTLYRAANPSLQAVVLAALEAQGQEK